MSGVTEVATILRAQPRPQNWTALEVRRWLEAIELDVYAPTFEAAGVQGADLIGMDADALKRRLGVAHLGHRTKLLKEIAVLANRAMLSLRRGEEGKTKDFVQKRKELMDTMYPDRVRRELKAQQEEKLLEARAAFWTPDNRKTLGAVDGMVNQSRVGVDVTGGRPRAANRKQPDESLIITEGNATANMRAGENQHRAQYWGAPPAQQRAIVLPATGGRQRAQRATRPQTAGASRAADRGMPTTGWQDGNSQQEETEVLDPPKPSERMQNVAERIKQLETAGNYEELIKAWVEYGACVRMEHSDKDKLLVRTHFNLATTYLRQKLVPQALYQFKEADLVNQANDAADDALSFKCRIMEGMGICETRLGHFKAAETLLEQAKWLCMKKAIGKDGNDDILAQPIEEIDVEDMTDADGAIASVCTRLGGEGLQEDTSVGCGDAGKGLDPPELARGSFGALRLAAARPNVQRGNYYTPLLSRNFHTPPSLSPPSPSLPGA